LAGIERMIPNEHKIFGYRGDITQPDCGAFFPPADRPAPSLSAQEAITVLN